MTRRTVRQKVLEFVALHRDTNAVQIGESLGLEAASVRYHLGILRKDGRVARSGRESRRSRGRPVELYRLSDRLRGDNLSGLAMALLDAIEGLPPRPKDALLAGLAQGLMDQVGAIDSTGSGPRRLATLVDRLNGFHYEATWEAGSEGPRVLFGRCPYAAVIERHPELCQMDGKVLSGLLGAGATQTAKIKDEPGGTAHCVFLLK